MIPLSNHIEQIPVYIKSKSSLAIPCHKTCYSLLLLALFPLQNTSLSQLFVRQILTLITIQLYIIHSWHIFISLKCKPFPPLDSKALLRSSPYGTSGKQPAHQRRRLKRHGFNPRVGKIPWRRDGNLLQYSCLENPMDSKTCGLQSMGSQSRTQPKTLSTTLRC